jgi:hypothetical protein
MNKYLIRYKDKSIRVKCGSSVYHVICTLEPLQREDIQEIILIGGE